MYCVSRLCVGWCGEVPCGSMREQATSFHKRLLRCWITVFIICHLKKLWGCFEQTIDVQKYIREVNAYELCIFLVMSNLSASNLRYLKRQ